MYNFFSYGRRDTRSIAYMSIQYLQVWTFIEAKLK